jgi:hypothetical protein
VGRIDLDSVVRDFTEDIIQLDKGFLFTIREMFVHPGATLLDYLSGKRKRHVKPFTYLIVLSTLYYLVTLAIGQSTWIDDLISGWMTGAIEKSRDAEVSPMVNWFAKNYAYLTLFLVPVFSLGSYLSFRGFGRNYFEHIVANSFITGHQAIIYSLFALISSVFNSEFIEMLPFLTAIAYTFWVYWQWFSNGSRVMNILRSALTYMLHIVFCVILGVGMVGLSQLF